MSYLSRRFSPRKLLLLAAVAALMSAPAPARAQVVDSIAAVVNGRVITKSDIDRELSMYGSELSDKATRELTLEALIERHLLEERAQKMKLGVSDREIGAAVDNIRKQFRLDVNQFKQAVTRQGVTWEGYQAGVRNEILRMKVFGAAMGQELQVDDERLGAYYLKNAELFRQPPKVRILDVSTPKGSRQAELIRAKVAKGEDFKTAAKDIAGVEPYDTGLLSLDGLNDAFKNALAPLKPGQVSDVIDAGDSDHVVLVVEKTPGVILPFEQVKEKVREKFTTEGEQELYKGWMEQQKKKAAIQRMP